MASGLREWTSQKIWQHQESKEEKTKQTKTNLRKKVDRMTDEGATIKIMQYKTS
jgi:hypothetical protein